MNPVSPNVETLADGTTRITVTGPLPTAGIVENSKYPWTPWNTAYQRKQLVKDGARLLQSVANLRQVETTLATRAAHRQEQKATKQLAAAAAATQQPATVQQSAPATIVPEAPASPAPSRTARAAKSAKKSGKKVQ